MNKQEILRFSDILKHEFFFRLEDETAPAGKEFSYVDLLGFLDIAYEKVGISQSDVEEYSMANRPDINNLFEYFPDVFKELYDAELSWASTKQNIHATKG